MLFFTNLLTTIRKHNNDYSELYPTTIIRRRNYIVNIIMRALMKIYADENQLKVQKLAFKSERKPVKCF